MATSVFSPRIGIYGLDETETTQCRGCSLWPLGYAAAVTEAGGTPVPLEMPSRYAGCEDILADLDGVLFVSREPADTRRAADEEWLCRQCQKQRLPFLGVDEGLHALNTTCGGTLYLDLARECPQALQHQHVPEPGDRHAINVTDGTRLAALYGEGEIVVNSEHRRAVCRVARGFRIAACALDGVIEAIEAEDKGWFALGVQWHPASASTSGLDIQLFRGLVEACVSSRSRSGRTACLQAA
jgi:putative glutamine amidotransferase